jgi:hypothetical protein
MKRLLLVQMVIAVSCIVFAGCAGLSEWANEPAFFAPTVMEKIEVRPAQEPTLTGSCTDETDSTINKMKALNELYEDGIFTEEEYQTKRKQLLYPL